jgi:hypothetical protein
MGIPDDLDDFRDQAYGSDAIPFAPTTMLFSMWKANAELAGYAQQGTYASVRGSFVWPMSSLKWSSCSQTPTHFFWPHWIGYTPTTLILKSPSKSAVASLASALPLAFVALYSDPQDVACVYDLRSYLCWLSPLDSHVLSMWHNDIH